MRKDRRVYKNIMVPLDGSKPAEVCDCARQQGAKLNILRVTYAKVFPGADPADSQLKVVGEAEDYTQMVQRRLEEEGFTVESHVRYGFPVEEILDHAKRRGVDLIAMATHGRSGPARWMLGSVAEEVLRHALVPVLLFRAGGAQEAGMDLPSAAEVDERRKVS